MDNINVNEITLNGKTYVEKGTEPQIQIKQIEGEAFQIGKAYFIRTVTFHYTGIVVGVDANNISITKAAWIADSGRWAQALENGTLSEVEPYPEDAVVIINRHALCDASPWKHTLPRTQK